MISDLHVFMRGGKIMQMSRYSFQTLMISDLFMEFQTPVIATSNPGGSKIEVLKGSLETSHDIS